MTQVDSYTIDAFVSGHEICGYQRPKSPYGPAASSIRSPGETSGAKLGWWKIASNKSAGIDLFDFNIGEPPNLTSASTLSARGVTRDGFLGYWHGSRLQRRKNDEPTDKPIESIFTIDDRSRGAIPLTTVSIVEPPSRLESASNSWSCAAAGVVVSIPAGARTRSKRRRRVEKALPGTGLHSQGKLDKPGEVG